ncbi:cyanophycin synthetase [Brevibacterium sp. Mu109]|uniref:hypothetical protein n=1 Tax=Brevibacterium sp. Mu109 TaxID=1255669 RepID=UPI000C5B1682|nr:hypothetical protein [Brevibacterium sp. Mu109]SMX95536.1 cyanophycin synthetase [Brevibacterium sp. Mu109]
MEMLFKNLEITPDSVKLRAEYQDTVDLHFDFDRRLEVSSTQVALALTTLCGTKYDAISFDFEVDASAMTTISVATGAEVSAVQASDSPRITSESGHLLSFSGGFDSLAAWRMMPEDSHLVSMDFGGWFQRESEFFRSFDTLVVKTNARSVPTRRTPLTLNHWSFMALGAILTAQHFNAKYHTFGQILAESLSRNANKSSALPVLTELGFIDAGYAKGLTEVGTASVILQSDPGIVSNSLKSLAGPKDRKLFRKAALSALVAEKLGVTVALPELSFARSPRIDYGADYATTLSALYCIAKGADEKIIDLFESVPTEAFDLARGVSMNFMEKLNWDSYMQFPAPLKGGLWNKMHQFGLEPYTENDWDELKAVRNHLAEARLAAN